MRSAFLSYKASQVHYSYSGGGSKLLVCLHGYGESEQSFHFLEQYLSAEYRILSIDLPFHGKTQWNDGPDCNIHDLLAIIHSIQAALVPATSTFSVLGYSMGGRLALGLLQAQPAAIEKVVLLAPDGLKVNWWYWLATQTYTGNKLFLFTMQHPSWFFLFLRMANRLGFVNQSIVKFVRHFIADKAARMQLYHRWTCFRTIKPNLPLLKKIIGQHQVPVRLLYGQYDRIILHTRGEKFRHDIESFCTLQVIPTGHQLLQPKHAAVVVPLIQL